MAANILEDDDTPSGEVLEFTPDHEGVVETDDKGAIVEINSEVEPPADETDFYMNLAETMDETDLEQLAQELIQKIDYDKDCRKERDHQQEMTIRRTGLGEDAPGGASFEGASKVVHPMLTKATVEFESRAIGELMPSSGPVKDFIAGTVTEARAEKARRKSKYMNWQFRVQMPEFRSELEQLLIQLPLGGSQYLRIVYDHKRKRPVPMFVPVDDVYLPYSATSYHSSERSTYVEHITKFEFSNRVKSGQYRILTDEEIHSTAMVPETTESEKATQKIEGKSESAYNADGLRDVYQVSVNLEIEDEFGFAPYLVDIDSHSHKILSVMRNWEEDDQAKDNMSWMAEFGFVPWRGAYCIGLGHMIGWLSAAATGALRALLDSAHINNLPTLLKLKGTNFSGQNISLAATQITEVEGGIATDDIRKLMMPVPFHPPSTVLVELLGLLIKEGQDTVKTALDNLTENSGPEMPVGTTLALIEQGLKVLSAIHQRLHASMDQVIKILHRINRMYITTEEVKDNTGEIMALRKDFQGPMDVIPVSDPNVFSDVQRFAQLQMVAARAQGNPLYDQRKVEELILERTKIPNATDLLIPAPKPEWMNAVNENVAASLGRPIAAFPEQDHLAHLQVHLDFMQSPVFGMLEVTAPHFMPMILPHLREHIVMWYVNQAYETSKGAMAPGQTLDDIMKKKDPGVQAELDKLLATLSPELIQKGEQLFSKLPPIISEGVKIAQKYAPPPADPAIQVANIQKEIEMAKLQGKSQDLQAKEQGSTQRTQIKEQGSAQRTAAQQQGAATVTQIREHGETQRATQKQFTDKQIAKFKEDHSDARNLTDNEVRERMNQQDNLTAMTIAAAEIEEDENTRLTTGGGINPGG